MPTPPGGPTGSSPAGTCPPTTILDEIEQFHANLIAALEWSADQPPLGLRLLRGVARAWEDLGRAGDAMVAADRLLTDDNAERYGAEWLGGRWHSVTCTSCARGPTTYGELLEQIEAVAGELGDDYHRAPCTAGARSALDTRIGRSAGHRPRAR